MIIAVIPARGGSKRIPRKNIKIFSGEPMISYAINAAKKLSLFDKIIVSTDDIEIANIAKKYGAEVPFLRPSELSDDYTTTTPVINHAIESMTGEESNIDYACCIYPSVPLIKFSDILDSFNYMIKEGFESCIPVTPFQSPPQRALSISEDGSLQRIFPEYEFSRSQDLQELFYDVGQFYWGSKNAWKNDQISRGIPFIIPNWRVVDIDTQDDWSRAEIIFNSLKKELD